MTVDESWAGISIAPTFQVHFGPVQVNDAELVADPVTVRAVGLTRVGTGVTLVDSMGDLSRSAPAVVVAAVPDAIADAVRLHGDSAAAITGFLAPAAGGGLLELGAQIARHGWSMTELRTDGEVVYFGVRPRAEEDLVNAQIMMLVRAWIAERDRFNTLQRQARANAFALRSILKVIDQVPLPMGDDESSPAVPVAEGHAEELKTLAGLRRSYDELQRKYDSLAASRMGGAQLRYWDRRKGKQPRG